MMLHIICTDTYEYMNEIMYVEQLLYNIQFTLYSYVYYGKQTYGIDIGRDIDIYIIDIDRDIDVYINA